MRRQEANAPQRRVLSVRWMVAAREWPDQTETGSKNRGVPHVLPTLRTQRVDWFTQVGQAVWRQTPPPRSGAARSISQVHAVLMRSLPSRRQGRNLSTTSGLLGLPQVVMSSGRSLCQLRETDLGSRVIMTTTICSTYSTWSARRRHCPPVNQSTRQTLGVLLDPH